MVKLFGERHSVSSHISYVLQLRDITLPPPTDGEAKPLPKNVASYVSEFEADVPTNEYQHPHFSYRLIFVRKLTNSRSQADRAVEFVGADSDLAGKINKEYWVQKEVEKPKHRPSQIVSLMREEGYTGFNMHDHTKLWKAEDAKNRGKGYGVDIAGQWYWYERWVEIVRKHCADNRNAYTD